MLRPQLPRASCLRLDETAICPAVCCGGGGLDSLEHRPRCQNEAVGERRHRSALLTSSLSGISRPLVRGRLGPRYLEQFPIRGTSARLEKAEPVQDEDEDGKGSLIEYRAHNRDSDVDIHVDLGDLRPSANRLCWNYATHFCRRNRDTLSDTQTNHLGNEAAYSCSSSRGGIDIVSKSTLCLYGDKRRVKIWLESKHSGR